MPISSSTLFTSSFVSPSSSSPWSRIKMRIIRVSIGEGEILGYHRDEGLRGSDGGGAAT